VMLPSEEEVEGGSSELSKEDEAERTACMKRKLQIRHSLQSALERSENPREGAQHGRVVHRNDLTLTLVNHLPKAMFQPRLSGSRSIGVRLTHVVNSYATSEFFSQQS
jgi:hypothetical protein